MVKFDLGRSLKKTKETLQGAVDTVKTASKDVKLSDVKLPEVKVPDIDAVQDKINQVKDSLLKKETSEDADISKWDSKSISTHNAMKIIYYMMAADGQIFQSEEEKFDAIGAELDPEYANHKDQIIKECQVQMDKVIDPEDYNSVLKEGMEEALNSSRTTEDSFITPKLLLWDLLTIAFSDDTYDETERRLIKQVVRKLNIDKSVFLEMESSMYTLVDLEKELQWIKTTDRPYLTIEMMVNEIADRKNVIFESVKDLIMF